MQHWKCFDKSYLIDSYVVWQFVDISAKWREIFPKHVHFSKDLVLQRDSLTIILKGYSKYHWHSCSAVRFLLFVVVESLVQLCLLDWVSLLSWSASKPAGTLSPWCARHNKLQLGIRCLFWTPTRMRKYIAPRSCTHAELQFASQFAKKGRSVEHTTWSWLRIWWVTQR